VDVKVTTTWSVVDAPSLGKSYTEPPSPAGEVARTVLRTVLKVPPFPTVMVGAVIAWTVAVMVRVVPTSLRVGKTELKAVRTVVPSPEVATLAVGAVIAWTVDVMVRVVPTSLRVPGKTELKAVQPVVTVRTVPASLGVGKTVLKAARAEVASLGAATLPVEIVIASVENLASLAKS
jgi:hypothetical protein